MVNGKTSSILSGQLTSSFMISAQPNLKYYFIYGSNMNSTTRLYLPFGLRNRHAPADWV